MASFQFTESDISAIEAGIVSQLTSGVASVDIRTNGRTVTYQDPLRRLEAIASLAADETANTDGGILKPRFEDAT